MAKVDWRRESLDEKFRAVKSNAPRLNRIAVFNDDFRDALKGHWGTPTSLGFASGQTLNEETVKYGIVLQQPSADNLQLCGNHKMGMVVGSFAEYQLCFVSR
jgi:hypothetical protein